jgi:hypothetical protein
LSVRVEVAAKVEKATKMQIGFTKITANRSEMMKP